MSNLRNGSPLKHASLGWSGSYTFLESALTLPRPHFISVPIYPMFGRGLTKLQPAYVEDVAEAIVRTLKQTDSTFEFGGPRVYSYEELIKVVACEAGLKPRLIPVPFAAWHVLAWLAKILSRPPITQNQVELMQIDTVASSELPGFKTLGITPVAVEEVLQEILWDH